MNADGRRFWAGAVWVVVLGLAGCGDEPAAGDGVPAAAGTYLLVSTVSYDFQSASFGRVDLPSRTAWPDLGSVHSDHSLRYSGGFLFAINRRGGDNLQRLDPATQTTLWQYSTGAGTNPQDILVVGPHRAYVPLYETAELLVVDPDPASEAALVLETIDLSAFSDADGIPEAGPVALVDDVVLVALQRLDRANGFLATNPSYLVAFDAMSGLPVDLDPATAAVHVELSVANPFIAESFGDELWLGCVGLFGEADGAIVRFDVSELAFLAPAVTEAALNGDLSAFAAGAPAYVVATDFELQSQLSVVSPGSPPITWASGLGSVEDLALDDTFVFVPDRSRDAPGVRIFRRDTGEEATGTPLSATLPPWHLELVAP